MVPTVPNLDMKFKIKDLLVVTTCAAGLLALGKYAIAAFLVLFLPATFLVIFCPFAIIFTTIIFADQRGQMLDLNSNPTYGPLKRIWVLSLLIVILVWIGFFVSFNSW